MGYEVGFWVYMSAIFYEYFEIYSVFQYRQLFSSQELEGFRDCGLSGELCQVLDLSCITLLKGGE